MATEKKKVPMGCWIALGATLLVVLVCGGSVAVIGVSTWNNPDFQRVVSVGGAAFEMARDAQNQPGAAELRAAGCVSAVVITPELMERFAESMALDGGPQNLPEFPIVNCGARRGTTLTCESIAATYMASVDPAPAEVAITLQVQGQRQAQCQGIYDASGTRVREIGSNASQFDQVGQTP